MGCVSCIDETKLFIQNLDPSIFDTPIILKKLAESSRVLGDG
jgi:hypothetical protein